LSVTDDGYALILMSTFLFSSFGSVVAIQVN